MKTGPLLLVSGLPLNDRQPTSFERQLRLLARAFDETGKQAIVLGPEADLQGADAAVLLGYPDQFPFLREASPSFPIFLWAQCSRPPARFDVSDMWTVPLTAKSDAFLRRASTPHVLPVIPHGVDTAFLRLPSQEERRAAKRSFGLSDRFVVGAVGANAARKRFDLILQAFAYFASGACGASLVVKTDRPASVFGTDIPVASARLGISPVVVSKTIPPGEMRNLYWSLDALLNLSEWEGFGLPVAEAMACGVPVITHDVQGPGEIVPYGEHSSQRTASRGTIPDRSSCTQTRAPPPAILPPSPRMRLFCATLPSAAGPRPRPSTSGGSPRCGAPRLTLVERACRRLGVSLYCRSCVGGRLCRERETTSEVS